MFGPGDEAELSRAVEAGGNVRLVPGVYDFGAGWTLEEDLVLIGAGAEQTRLMFRAPAESRDAVINWNGHGSLHLQGVRIEYVGAEAANVLTVLAGSAQLGGLDLVGGVTSHNDPSVGSGLVIAGGARAVLTSSYLRENGAHGVSVRGAAEATMLDNSAIDNGWSGFALFGRSSGALHGNSSERNGDHGIGAWGEAEVELSGHVSKNNGWSGVALFDLASGTLWSTLSAANGEHGMAVWDSARAVIADSHASSNRWSGVTAYGQATVQLRQTTLERNEQRGILVFGSAELQAERNLVRWNAGAGILIAEDATGAFADNRVVENGKDGFVCLGLSAAVIRNNLLEGNGGYGHAWELGTACELDGNDFSGNHRGDQGAWEPWAEEGRTTDQTPWRGDDRALLAATPIRLGDAVTSVPDCPSVSYTASSGRRSNAGGVSQ